MEVHFSFIFSKLLLLGPSLRHMEGMLQASPVLESSWSLAADNPSSLVGAGFLLFLFFPEVTLFFSASSHPPPPESQLQSYPA